jgi:glycerate kinase
LNTVFKEQYGVDADLIPGSGAAGGLGAGCRVLLKAELLRGIDLIFGVTNF